MDNLCLFVAVLSFLFLSSFFPCLCLCTFSFSFCSCLRIVVAVFLHDFVSQSPIGTCHGDLCLFICDILLFRGDFVSLCVCFDQLWVLFLYVHFFVLIVFIFFKSACGCFLSICLNHLLLFVHCCFCVCL